MSAEEPPKSILKKSVKIRVVSEQIELGLRRWRARARARTDLAQDQEGAGVGGASGLPISR